MKQERDSSKLSLKKSPSVELGKVSHRSEKVTDQPGKSLKSLESRRRAGKVGDDLGKVAASEKVANELENKAAAAPSQ